MNRIKTVRYLLASTLIVSVLAGCVTEQVNGPFKQPTPEDMAKAASIYVELAYQHIQNKNYEQAMYNVKKALEINPNSPETLMALAQTYQYQGDTDKARDAFKKTISVDKTYSPAHMTYGQFLFDQKEYEAACDEFRTASSNDFYQNRADAFGMLGACRLMLGDVPGAEAAMKRSLALNEKQVPVLLDLTDLKFKQQQYVEAKEYFDKHAALVRGAGQVLGPRALWLGIQLERIFSNPDAEASLGLFLKNTYPYSKEALEYQEFLKKK